MSPAMQRFLQEGAELLNQESNVMDRLMSYLDNNLMTLHSSLSAENFDRTLEIIWANNKLLCIQSYIKLSSFYNSVIIYGSIMKWCLAINNIGYVQESLAPFVQDLNTEEVLIKLADYRSELEAHRCRETLKLVIANAEETVGNKIADIIQKMSPAMQRFLQEGAELLNQESNVMDRLMSYLDNNLMTLHSSLSAENFDRTLEIIWANLETILLSLIESGVEA
ncbi:hypothetical protein J437_LFUL005065, partial [Ladona fulva]